MLLKCEPPPLHSERALARRDFEVGCSLGWDAYVWPAFNWCRGSNLCAGVAVQGADALHPGHPGPQVLHSAHSDWVTQLEHIPGELGSRRAAPAAWRLRRQGEAGCVVRSGLGSSAPVLPAGVPPPLSPDRCPPPPALHPALPPPRPPPDLGLVSSSLDASLAMLDLERRCLAARVTLHRKGVRTFGYSPAFSLVARWG